MTPSAPSGAPGLVPDNFVDQTNQRFREVNQALTQTRDALRNQITAIESELLSHNETLSVMPDQIKQSISDKIDQHV